MFRITLYTVLIAFLSTVVATVVGVAASFFTANRNFLGRKLLLSLSIVPLCVPPLIVALANISAFGINGRLNNLLVNIVGIKKTPLSLLYSMWGIILVQGFYNFPFVTGLLTVQWQNLNPEQEMAARIFCDSEFKIFLKVTLPRLLGPITTCFIQVFLFCFFSFMIVLLFGPIDYTTMEVELYYLIRNSNKMLKGVVLCAIEFLIALGIVLIYSRISKRSQSLGDGISFTKISACGLCKFPYASKKQKILEFLFFILIMALILMFFVYPAVCIIISSLTVKRSNINYFSLWNFYKLFSNKTFLMSIFYSVFVGCITATLSTFLSFIYASFIKIYRKQENICLQTIPVLPMAISSVALSWMFMLIFHRGNILMLIFAQVLLYLPIAYRQVQNGLNAISIQTDKAALILSKNHIDIMLRVYLPSCKKVLLTTFGYCFAMSCGDASLPLVLSIPKFSNLALYTYKLSSSYRFNQACASGILLCAMCSIIFIALNSVCTSHSSKDCGKKTKTSCHHN